MANLFDVSTLVAQAMTEFFFQKSPLLNTANREYVEQFAQQEYMTGGTINIKIPGYAAVENGLSVSATDIQDLIVPYTITTNDIYNVTRNLNLFEQRFDIRGGTNALTKPQKKAIVDNYAYPAFQALEAAIETTAANRLLTTAYFSPVDLPSKLAPVNTFSSISQVSEMMDYLKLDQSNRVIMMNITDARRIADSLQNMFNSAINQGITMNARVGGPDKGHLAGFDMFQSTELLTHTAGALGAITSGITVSSVNAGGTTITLTGVTSTTSQLVNAGDRFAIPSVNILSPVNGNVLPYGLVVTAATNANGDGAGNVTITISYPLMASGEHANVTAIPSNGATVLSFPSYKMNFAYVPSGLSAVPLMLGDIFGATNSDAKGDNKCPVKVVAQGSVSSFSNIFRIAMLVGVQAFAPYVVALPSSIS